MNQALFEHIESAPSHKKFLVTVSYLEVRVSSSGIPGMRLVSCVDPAPGCLSCAQYYASVIRCTTC